MALPGAYHVQDQTVYRIDGREVGEMQIVAYACGQFCGIEDFRKYNGMRIRNESSSPAAQLGLT